MRLPSKLAVVLFAPIVAAGCGTDAPQPPPIPQSAYGGTGDLMARCMQYASESYCQREIWGGNER